MDVDSFLRRVTEWAARCPQIAAIGLVGSRARGNPSPSSDVDLVIRSEDPQAFLRDRAWTEEFGDVVRCQLEGWGRVTSLRVWFADGLEVEFGFTDVRWGMDPDDLATQAVIRDGYRAVYARDPA